jgi:hypothetical protein
MFPKIINVCGQVYNGLISERNPMSKFIHEACGEQYSYCGCPNDQPTAEMLAEECSALMDEMEAVLKGGEASSEDTNADPRMVRISEIATLLAYFRPDLLDPRFA